MNDSTRREFGKLFGLTAVGAYKATYDYLDSEPTSEIIREDGEVCVDDPGKEYNIESIESIDSSWSYQP